MWEKNAHYAKVAFMNSMASNIGGSTIHSWGEIGFVDKTGNYCKPKQKNESDTPTLNNKCASLRWLLIDEIEAAGCELLTDLNDNMVLHTPDAAPYKRPGKARNTCALPWPYAGVNTLFIGDFWQIPPVGQVAVMGNPFSKAALESARASAGLAQR